MLFFYQKMLKKRKFCLRIAEEMWFLSKDCKNDAISIKGLSKKMQSVLWLPKWRILCKKVVKRWILLKDRQKNVIFVNQPFKIHRNHQKIMKNIQISSKIYRKKFRFQLKIMKKNLLILSKDQWKTRNFVKRSREKSEFH